MRAKDVNFLPFSVVCPDGFEQYQRRCYKFGTDAKSWNDARTACQAISSDYDLVTIDTEELATYFVQKVDSWIGLSDLATEGTMTWVNGNELSYGKTVGQTPWSSGEPNVRTFLQHFNLFIQCQL